MAPVLSMPDRYAVLCLAFVLAPSSANAQIVPLPVVNKSITKSAKPAAIHNTIDRMVGQMIVAGFDGQVARSNGARVVRKLLTKGAIGGVIVMPWNISSKKKFALSQLTAMTKSFRKVAGRLPPMISIDQEGGAVQRLKRRHGFPTTPSAARMAKRFTTEQASKLYTRLAKRLRATGINLNFGPVFDLNRNPRNPIIARRKRAYGPSATKVIIYAREFTKAHRNAGVLTVAKHFPGHGSSGVDSHHRLVDLTRTWAPVELVPYWALANHAASPDMVMTGHLYHPRFSDEVGMPASLSRKAIQDELRNNLGFRGLVITDDLAMTPVKKRFPVGERAVRAIIAGNDIVLLSTAARGNAKTVYRMHSAITAAVANGRIKRSQIMASYDRIIAAKSWLLRAHVPALRPTITKSSADLAATR